MSIMNRPSYLVALQFLVPCGNHLIEQNQVFPQQISKGPNFVGAQNQPGLSLFLKLRLTAGGQTAYYVSAPIELIKARRENAGYAPR